MRTMRRHDRQYVVRAHQQQRRRTKKDGEDQAIGRSKAGLSTKIHALVDALGNPLDFILTPARPMIWKAPMRCCRIWRPRSCWQTKGLRCRQRG